VNGILSFALLMMLSDPGMSAGGMYRWVDAHGHIHYGDQPPPGEAVQSLALAPVPQPPDPAAVQAQQDNLRRIDEAETERSHQATTQREAQQQAESRQAECASLRERRLQLERPRPLERQADGSFLRLDEAERATHIQDAERRIADVCADRR